MSRGRFGHALLLALFTLVSGCKKPYRVGEHTREVLRDLGYDDGAIDRMVSEKSIRVAV